MIGGGNDRLFRAICGVLGIPGLADDARFRTNPDRVRNRDELVTGRAAIVRFLTAKREREQMTVAAEFDLAEVFCGARELFQLAQGCRGAKRLLLVAHVHEDRAPIFGLETAPPRRTAARGIP